jgi:hypothetical protein
MRQLTGLAALALAIAIAAGGAAYATGAVRPAKSSGSAVIHACVNKRSGVVRIARRCRRSERALQWNIRGLRGLRGPRGGAGAAGARCGGGVPPGLTGSRGPA